MSAKKPSTKRGSANKRPARSPRTPMRNQGVAEPDVGYEAESKLRRRLGSDLRKVDAHKITSAEYDEIPELDEGFFKHATRSMGGKPVGRPPLAEGEGKQAVSIRFSPDVLAYFKAGGSGWQTRMDEALREIMQRERKKSES